MSNHSVGTFAALLILGCLFGLASITLFPTFAHAQMSELSEIQNGVFHLSHNNTGMNAETFANDQYIDEDQANFIASASRPEPYTPADDNYPFYLVDDYVLSTDLVIEYHYASENRNTNQSITQEGYFNVLGFYQPYNDTNNDLNAPKKRYLSRHNISLSNYQPKKQGLYYSDQKSDTTIFSKGIVHCKDFGDGNSVTGFEIRNYDIDDYEVTASRLFDKETNKLLLFGWEAVIDVHVARSTFYIWFRAEDTELMKRCYPTSANNSANICDSCLYIKPNPLSLNPSYKSVKFDFAPCQSCR